MFAAIVGIHVAQLRHNTDGLDTNSFIVYIIQ